MKITLIRSLILGTIFFTLCDFYNLYATVAFINSDNVLKVIDSSTDIVSNDLFVKKDKKLICFSRDSSLTTEHHIKALLWEILAKILNTSRWINNLESIEDDEYTGFNPGVLYTTYVSGGGGSESLYLFDNIPIIPSFNLNVIDYAYSRRHIHSMQGEFIINNGHKLYHTEPKSLSNILESLNASYSDIIIVSRLEMCPCCSRLLIGTFMSKLEKRELFPNNFFVISHNLLEEFKNQNIEKIREFLQDLKKFSLTPELFNVRKRNNIEIKLFQQDFRSIEELKTFLDLSSVDVEPLDQLYTCLRIHWKITQIEQDLIPHGEKHNILAQLIYKEKGIF